ncbi:MAG: PKD domain-containing protein [Deltaproteobacteria bacterium]|nr:PKD domain-containing protein [Deltaproteobacteria bacterium]
MLVAVSVLALAVSCGPPRAGDNQPPALRLRSPLIAPLQTPITFDATATSDDKGIAYLRVEPGDGSGAFEVSGLLFVHTFQAPATYHLGVTAFDAEGLESALSRSVTVVERYTPPYCSELLPCEHGAACDQGVCFVEGDSTL